MRTVIYWRTKDKKRQKEAMKELGVSYVSVNGESTWEGSEDKLRAYVEEGIIRIRRKIWIARTGNAV